MFLERKDSNMHSGAYEGHTCLLLQQIKNHNRNQPLRSFETLLLLKQLLVPEYYSLIANNYTELSSGCTNTFMVTTSDTAASKVILRSMTLCLSVEQNETIKVLKKNPKHSIFWNRTFKYSNFKNLFLKEEKMVKRYKSLLATVTLRTKPIQK